MINKKSYAVRMTAIAVAMMLGLTGCGKKEEKAPELLEPVTTNEAYRPVLLRACYRFPEIPSRQSAAGAS